MSLNQKAGVSLVIITLLLLMVNKKSTAQEIPKLVFEVYKIESQPKLENGGWGEWEDDPFNLLEFNNHFVIMDFYKKQMVWCIYYAYNNYSYCDTTAMGNIIIDSSKAPYIAAKFQISTIESNKEIKNNYSFFGYTENGHENYFLFHDGEYERTKHSLIWRKNKD